MMMGMAPAGASDASSVVEASVGMAVGAGVGLEVSTSGLTGTALGEVGVIEVVEVVAPVAPQPPITSVTAISSELRHRFIVIEPPFLLTTDSAERQTDRHA
jgi:hypothetical protein